MFVPARDPVTHGLTLEWRPSAELAFLLFLVAVAGAARPQMIAARPTARILAVVVAAMAFLNLVDAATPTLLGRDLNLYWDLPHLPSLFGLAGEAAGLWRMTGAIAFLSGAIFLLIAGITRIWREVLSALTDRRIALGFAVLLGVAMDDEGRSVVAPFVGKERFDVNGGQSQMNYPIVIGNDAAADKFGGLIGFPTSVLIDRDGKVTLIMPQVEMGQGIYTSCAMILAEELDAAFDTVSLEAAPPNDKLYANPVFGIQVTGNSNSVRAFWLPWRKAAAASSARRDSRTARDGEIRPRSRPGP